MTFRFLLYLCVLALTVGETRASTVRNVLLIVSDDLKAGVLGCYGDAKCETPNIDRLAAEGMVFERAYCQGTVCGPSRTSFMHSRYFGSEGKTLGETFIEHGFRSARVGKIFHMRVPGDIIAGSNGQDIDACWTERYNAPGLEAHTPGAYACLNLNIFTTELAGRESTKMPNRMFVTVQYEGSGFDQPDWKAATKSMELLRDFAGHREPFFLATGFVRPHYPNVAPELYFEKYPHREIQLPEVPAGDLDDIPPAGISGSNSKRYGFDQYPENQQRMWSGYYATVTFMDEQVGRLLDQLEALGLRESTAVVFTSDHGYHLGEHTFWQKADLHEEVTRVPLIVSVPGMKPGRSSSIVELMDIYPTACELTGTPIPESVRGASLVPVLKDPKATVKEAALSITRNGYSLRSDRWAYMRYHDGSEELYDMAEDPDQFTNIAGDPAHSSVLQEWGERLSAMVAKEKPPSRRGKAHAK
jgi:iduronate 2-sulfatase